MTSCAAPVDAEPLVLCERPLAGCTVLTLNRPRAMNALSSALREALARTIDGLRDDPAARVLILTGAGKAFCAGLDLKELAAKAASPGSALFGTARQADGGREDDPVHAIDRFPGPIIAAINGAAITGGFELALACDVLLASEAARFADTHGRVGVMPGWGLSQRLSRVVGPYRAKELSLTGNFLSAAQARDWGLVNRVVAPADLLPQAVALAADMLGLEPAMLVNLKRVIDDGYAQPFGAALRHERDAARRYADEAMDLGALEARRLALLARSRQPGQD